MQQAASKKSYHRGNVRTDLIRAASRVLRKEGLSALSLRHIAREVGIAPSAVYNHFRNREALLCAVAADGYRQLSELELKSYSGKERSPGVLKKMARQYVHFANENPELYRLMFSPEVVQYRTDPEFVEAGESSFAQSVDWWYGPGTFNADPLAMKHPLALSVWAIMHGLSMQIIDNLIVVDRSNRSEIDRIADLVMNTLVDGVGRSFDDFA